MGDRKIFSIVNTTNYHYSLESRGSGVFSIISEEDDGMPPQYYFFSEILTSVEDPIEIWEKGLFLLNIFNGAVNVSAPTREEESQVKFVKSFNWVTNENITPGNKESIFPIKPFLNDIQINSFKTKQLENLHFIEYSSILSITENDVENLLLLAGKNLNWTTLYSILDTLKHYSGKRFDNLIKKCGYTSKDIKAFTGTANNFGVLSTDSRHGNLGWGIPQNIMSLSESRTIILKLTNQYINDKLI